MSLGSEEIVSNVRPVSRLDLLAEKGGFVHSEQVMYNPIKLQRLAQE